MPVEDQATKMAALRQYLNQSGQPAYQTPQPVVGEAPGPNSHMLRPSAGIPPLQDLSRPPGFPNGPPPQPSGVIPMIRHVLGLDRSAPQVIGQ